MNSDDRHQPLDANAASKDDDPAQKGLFARFVESQAEYNDQWAIIAGSAMFFLIVGVVWMLLAPNETIARIAFAACSVLCAVYARMCFLMHFGRLHPSENVDATERTKRVRGAIIDSSVVIAWIVVLILLAIWWFSQKADG